MKPSPTGPDSRADEQASLWAARLDGSTLSAADRAALDAWLAADPRHRALLSQYCQFSADLEQQLPALVATGALAMPGTRGRRRPTARMLWFAASLAAAAAIVGGLWLRPLPQQTETVATSVAQRKTLKLADGSVVELNARTSLLVDLTARERHVRMADGQAFFTVAKDKSRPFIVETPAGAVRVTGTVFDVHADNAADLTVTVVQGSVQVTPSRTPEGRTSAPFALTAGQQLVAHAENVSKHNLTATEVDDTLAWRQGEIVFDGAPLSEALACFARYHGRAITVDRSVASLTVSARLKLDDLDGFLNDIKAFLPVHVARDDSSGAISVTPRTGG